MSAPTLERRIARWFAASLFLLYGVVATAIWATSRADARQVAVLTLETEAEVVAGYVAATGRLERIERLGQRAAGTHGRHRVGCAIKQARERWRSGHKPSLGPVDTAQLLRRGVAAAHAQG